MYSITYYDGCAYHHHSVAATFNEDDNSATLPETASDTVKVVMDFGHTKVAIKRSQKEIHSYNFWVDADRKIELYVGNIRLRLPPEFWLEENEVAKILKSLAEFWYPLVEE